MTNGTKTLHTYPMWELVAICVMALMALAFILGLTYRGAERAFATDQGPDLTVVNVGLVRQQDGSYQISAKVKNIGNKKAGASQLDMQINFPGGQLVGNTFPNVPALQPGAASQVFNLKGSIGSKRATGGFATADSGNDVAEKNENNNTVTASVGGISVDPDLGALPLETAQSSGGSAGVLAGMITVAGAAGAVALGGAAWYARRRWLR